MEGKIDGNSMSNGNVSCAQNPRWANRSGGGRAVGGAYFLAFIGAVVYYIGHAVTFGDGVFGFLKAIVWPALLVYKLLEFLKM